MQWPSAIRQVRKPSFHYTAHIANCVNPFGCYFSMLNTNRGLPQTGQVDGSGRLRAAGKSEALSCDLVKRSDLFFCRTHVLVDKRWLLGIGGKIDKIAQCIKRIANVVHDLHGKLSRHGSFFTFSKRLDGGFQLFRTSGLHSLPLQTSREKALADVFVEEINPPQTR